MYQLIEIRDGTFELGKLFSRRTRISMTSTVSWSGITRGRDQEEPMHPFQLRKSVSEQMSGSDTQKMPALVISNVLEYQSVPEIGKI